MKPEMTYLVRVTIFTALLWIPCVQARIDHALGGTNA